MAALRAIAIVGEACKRKDIDEVNLPGTVSVPAQ